MATLGRLPWLKFPLYALGQYLGSFFASIVVYLVYMGRGHCQQYSWEEVTKVTETESEVLEYVADDKTAEQSRTLMNPRKSEASRYYGRRIFFSRVNFVCWLLFGVRSTPVLPQWYVKDPGHSAKSAGGRLQLNMNIPLTQRSRSGLTMPLSRHSVGTY